ncbi:FAD-binding oxidoreductase [Streptomyces sp. 7-21]|jgi:hypothetical protein|uniref:FAD-binding oxidoreductase n=1 Tax=Streptomyces sp. 7-21 TaxID=2802283 RepID=UPI00191FB859|nr:FAD-binding oxidoreductase [Streptomyces sp. 7-21]MBL1066992.1 FAD-binding oxidoreductase [Streptomyces sp. 7-21]
MSNLSRRAVLSGATAVAGAGALPRPARAAGEDGTRAGTADGLVTVRPGDPRYGDLVVGNNQRWVASPEAVHLVRTTAETVAVVAEAVRSGKRLSVRSGGHCYADFVYHADADVIVDLSTMNRIGFDTGRQAFMVEAGARLGEIYDTLYRRWGVAVPGGVCPYVGIAGHATGGGYGLLSRRHGVVADHIEAVEVVVADEEEGARAVIASRESTGALRELWWACTGGGGGSFGVITRFWFRSAGASGPDPGGLLPRPPQEMLASFGELPWEGLTEEAFTALVRNFGTWYTDNAAAGAPLDSVSGGVFLRHRANLAIPVLCVMDGTVPGAEGMLAEHVAALTAGTGMPDLPARRLAWLDLVRLIGNLDPGTLTDSTKRSAVKSAYMRGPFTRAQCAAMYAAMSREDYANPEATVTLYAVCGGPGNDVPEDAVAYAHRNASYLALFESFWSDPGEDEAHLAWQRGLYADVFADSGGYPVPGDRYDGCYINSPDPDLTDPAYNASGVPWHRLYFKDNYARLQETKRLWDPADVFRHRHSVRLPS